MNGKLYPLLPWLHSSETCEHIFGEIWKLIKDFTYLDFLYMIPQLLVLVRAAVKLGYTGNSKSCTSGYTHTYFDTEDMDLAMLAIFLTDGEIKTAAKEAWDEADSLFTLLGVLPSDFMWNKTATGTQLPSINSWFAAGQDPVLDQLPSASLIVDPEIDNDGFAHEEITDSDIEDSEAGQLQGMIDQDKLADYES